MRRWTRILSLAIVLATPGAAAWAYWSQSGSGSASATTASLDAASISVPGSAINSVTVTWTAQGSLNPSSAANSAITYTVERRLGAGTWAAIASGGCSGSKPRGTTSCVDAPAVAGSYSYRAVAAYHSWTATSTTAGPVTFTIDVTPPAVSSIVRADANPTNAATVRWTVTFSESVTGVDTADFALATTGSVSGATITSVTGSGTTYTITVASGTGDGTLGLNVVDDDTIIDALANKLGGTGAANGNFTGQTYTIDKTPLAAPASASVTSAIPPTSFICSIASTTRFINNAGKAAVNVNAVFPGASVAGDAMVFSITTPGSTPITATVPATPPSTSVPATLDLTTLLDGAITMTVRTRDLAGNLSILSAGPSNLITKDTAGPLTAVYDPGFLGLNPTITGDAECGATVSAQKTTGGSPVTKQITSGIGYSLDAGLLAILGPGSFDVTSIDLVGNTHGAIRVP